ncbi:MULTISPECIES: hypothetical protein [unclassified Lentilitoribacter]|jgi:hypothetical protein|uniref:hypothetical protein n=1 Tax=unclassified Lentilitoribacter TaxID=2647570 RepID=UPI0013A6AACC|nr:hypothetical protein [Lentilitoribacter sp. Alg239-R112]
MAKIIRLLDYEPVDRPQGFQPKEPAKILFFTGVRYERPPNKKNKRSKRNERAPKIKRTGA